MIELQEKKKPFSGSTLKLIAVITMLIDHTAHVLLEKIPFFTQTLIKLFDDDISFYMLFRTIGRMAFPIYAFLLTEGFLHTHDRKKYALNLFIFALISEIPWNLEHCGKISYEKQNVFFTLFLGLLCMMIYETYQENHKKQLLYLLAVAFGAMLLNADYGLKGVGFIFAMYLLREKKIPQMFVSSAFLSGNFFYTSGVMLAFLPINLYNQERGFIRGKLWKYAFYAFYPVHMLILYYIKLSVWGYK